MSAQIRLDKIAHIFNERPELKLNQEVQKHVLAIDFHVTQLERLVNEKEASSQGSNHS